jgi:3-oxoacyl-[acyl-carrier-protein] synthase II
MSSTPRRAVITGIGPISAIGTGVDEFWNGLRRQHSPIRRVTRFDPSPWRSHLAAEVDDFTPEDFIERKTARRLDRYSQFAIAATRLALQDAGLEPARADPERVAVQFGSALGGLAFAEEQVTRYATRGLRTLDPRVALTTFGGAASCSVAIEFGFTGPNSTNSMSCAAGAIAIGEAWRLIRDGQADVAITGGIETPIAPLTFGAFAVIRAMSTRNHDPEHACRPFDRGRDGFIMGEGACVITIEEYEHARRRNARVYAEVKGYASTNDAFHMTQPLPSGGEAARAMRLAIRRAGIEPARIEYINPHGSSTPLNDSTETSAIKQVFREHARKIPISGTKPYYAHALGASGALEIAICALAMTRGWIPPTLNFHEGDDSCDLDYVPRQGRAILPEYALSNSFGFGGINAAIVLRRSDAPSSRL